MTNTTGQTATLPTPVPEYESEHDLEIEAQQQKLADSITAARDAVRAGQRAAEALTSGSAWHVEYAEGTNGADITAFLADAGRALRAAEALMPE